MSTTPTPLNEHLGMPQQGQAPMDTASYLREVAAQQANTTGLTSMQPSMSPTAPVQRQFTQPGAQQTSAFGVGERGAHQRESMQNLVKASQSLANQFGQQQQAKQNREYEQVIGRFMGATQGVAQAQAQVLQATQALKQNPNDSAAQAQLQTAKAALQQNQTILNDMSQDKKAHKVITKAFGVDDKNANSPERAAAIEAVKKQMGVGQAAAGIMSQLPQTQQLSPQAQQQQAARQAGVVGAPATQGQVLKAITDDVNNKIKAGAKQEEIDTKLANSGLKREVDSQGISHVVPMTPDEIATNTVLQSKLDYKQAQIEAQNAIAASKTDPNNPELQLKALDAQAKMLSAQASMLRAQKYVPGGAGGGAGGVDVKGLANQMLGGKIAPAELPGFGKVRAQVFAEAAKINPNFSPATADQQYKFANNPRVQQQMSLINSLTGYGNTKGSLDEVLSQSDKIKRTSFPPVNSLEMSALIASGDKEAAAYAAVATDVADQIGQIMAAGGTGGTSDFKLRQAQAVLSGKFTPKQLAATARELKVLLDNRQKAFIAQGGPFLKSQMEAMGEGSTGESEDDKFLMQLGKPEAKVP